MDFVIPNNNKSEKGLVFHQKDERHIDMMLKLVLDDTNE